MLVTRQPLVIEDVTEDPRFAKDFAEGTGYIPKGLMAVPLLHDERALGVLEVLDRPQRSQFSLVEMDLLGLFANQAAIALDLLAPCPPRRGRARRRAGKAPTCSPGWRGQSSGSRTRSARPTLRMLGALEEILRSNEGG